MIVDVAVIVFPDGLAHWIRKDNIGYGQLSQHISDCVEIWKQHNEKMCRQLGKNFQVTVAEVRMLEEYYSKLVATDRFIEAYSGAKQ